MSTTDVQSLHESFRECENDYSIWAISVLEKVVITEKYPNPTLSDDFWEGMCRKAQMEVLELKDGVG